MQQKDYYKLLGINRNAKINEIKIAYRKLAKKYHPDANKSYNAEELFKQVNEVYHILSDPLKRKEYDNSLPSHTTDQDNDHKANAPDFERYNENWEKAMRTKYGEYSNLGTIDESLGKIKLFFGYLSGYISLIGGIFTYITIKPHLNTHQYFAGYGRWFQELDYRQYLVLSLISIIAGLLLVFPFNFIDKIFNLDLNERRKNFILEYYKYMFIPAFPYVMGTIVIILKILLRI